MEFVPADPLSLGIFIIFALIMYVGIVLILKKTPKFLYWFLLFNLLIFVISLVALTGIGLTHTIPILPLLFVLIFAFTFYFSFSKSGKKLSELLPLTLLIGFQGFRLPLELILHHWANIGTIPKTMTWTGSNWDVMAGIISLLAIPFIKRSKFITWMAQLCGFFLLLNVLRTVVMSLPLPFSWPLEKPLLLAMYFPYALIVPIFVIPAFIGHLLVFRKLLHK